MPPLFLFMVDSKAAKVCGSLDSSQAVCFQKKSHFLCVPKSQDCCLHRNSGVVDGGGSQFPERGRFPVKSPDLTCSGSRREGLGCAVLCKLGAFHNCTESRRKCLLCSETTVPEHRNVL